MFIDLDGTIVEYIEGKRPHRKTKFRSFFTEFVTTMMATCDLYLYSFTEPIRLKCLWQKYYSSHFKGFFDLRYWFSKKKSLRAFKDLNIKMLIIDDSLNMIHKDTKDMLIPIERWTGDESECTLVEITEVINEKWSFALKLTL